jgi:predicted ferric reductase
MTERGRYRWRSAIGWLLVFAGIALLPLALAWIGAKPGRGWLTELGVGFGLVGLGLMVLQTWTSGREQPVARNLGADNLLHFHRHLGLFAVLMALAHPWCYSFPTRTTFAISILAWTGCAPGRCGH